MKASKIFFLIIPLIVVLILGGCDNIDNTQSTVQLTQNGQFFPVEKAPPIIDFNDGAMQGPLIRDDDGYLRVANHLIIWPHGYSCEKEGNTLWILNADGEKCCEVGDVVWVTGRAVYYDFVVGLVGAELPDNCFGPFWWTAEVFKEDLLNTN